jgi:hypothetical protein
MSLVPDDLVTSLDRIAAHVDEARAAVALKGQTAAGGRF